MIDFYSPLVCDEETFIELLEVTINRRKIELDKIYDKQFYIDNIWKAKLYTGFSNVLYQHPYLLYKTNIHAFIKHYSTYIKIQIKNNLQFSIENPLYVTFPQETANIIKSLGERIGVYRFNQNSQPYYIGQSKKLSERIPASLESTFYKSNIENITFQYIFCENEIRAREVEKYYIRLLKPIKNVTHKNQDISHLDESIPLFCDEINIEYTPYLAYV